MLFIYLSLTSDFFSQLSTMPNTPQSEKITEYRDPDFPAIFRDLPKLGSLLHCPTCNAEVFSDGINIDKAIAKCSNCHNVFPFEEEIKGKKWNRRRAEIFQPEGIEMFRLRTELNLDFKWQNVKSMHWFMVLFTIMWNFMILPAAVGAILSGQLMALLFMSAHIAVGVGLLFNLLSNFINRTYITVDEHHLTIDHRPIKNPFNPPEEIPVRNIEQIYVKRYVASRTNGRPSYGHAIMVILKKGRQIKLIEGMRNPDKALFIEQEIEYFLNIEDRRVAGEVE